MTNVVDVDVFSSRSPEQQLVKRMTDTAAAGGGYAVTFADVDAKKWHVAEGHQLEKFSLDAGTAGLARLTSSAPLNPTTWEWATQGLSTAFPIAFNNQTGGRKVEIGVVARLAQAKSTDAISVVYATQQAGNSGWQKIPLTPEFELRKFIFSVPVLDPGPYTKEPILVIHADATGGGRAAEILGVYVKQVTP
jgi:hypothetical protein